MSNFKEGYAHYYDAIHTGKNYCAEALKISNYIDSINAENKHLNVLDFGCGTGKHLNELSLVAPHFQLLGYDKSDYMISEAKRNYPKIDFSTELKYEKNTFDIVYSLFDVINYQITDNEVIQFLSDIYNECKVGGNMLLDSWNYETILNDPPENRTRRFDFDGRELSRFVEVSTDSNYRITDIDISITEVKEDFIILKERHSIRAFKPDEMRNFAKKCGFENIRFYSSDDWTKPLEVGNWRFFMTATKQ